MKDHILNKAKKIKLFISDVDGVMTDGTFSIDAQGYFHKRFHVHDGFGLKQLLQHGVNIAVITSQSADCVAQRMKMLGITELHQNCQDKLKIYEMLLKKYQLSDDEVAYIGDDLPDLPIMQRVGFAIAVANAHKSIKKMCDWHTELRGGDGAVREAIDFILMAKGLE